MDNIYLVKILTILDEIFFIGIWFYLLIQFGLKESVSEKLTKILLLLGISFSILYPAIITAAQYHIWNQNPLTRKLLNLPLESDVPVPDILRGFYTVFPEDKTYFVNYVFGRFWLEALITLVCAVAIYLFFKFVGKIRPAAISANEVLLATLAVVIAGWPGLLILIPLTLLLLVLFSFYNLLTQGGRQTSIKWPILLAIIIVLLLGQPIATFLGLGVLSI